MLGNTSASDAVVQFIKEADKTLSAHTKNGHYDVSYFSDDIVYLGGKVPKH